VQAKLSAEEWDFSNIDASELRAALLWEIRRECADVRQIVADVKPWLDRKLSNRNVRSASKRAGANRWPANAPFTEAEKAFLRAWTVFDSFIPHHEFLFLHKWNRQQKRAEHDRWLVKQLRPLVEKYSIPWLCLAQGERHRLCAILEENRTSNVVHVGSWWDAVGHFDRRKIDPGVPLKFSYSDYTSVLLTINWRLSKKRILAAIKKILDECEPEGIKHWSGRGKKNRDLLIALERLGMMRLLHRYTLAEVRLKVPEAWKLYETRKWYDERRRALRDFRAGSSYSESEKFFPISWQTKAQRSRSTSELPAK